MHVTHLHDKASIFKLYVQANKVVYNLIDLSLASLKIGSIKAYMVAITCDFIDFIFLNNYAIMWFLLSGSQIPSLQTKVCRSSLCSFFKKLFLYFIV